MKKRIKIRRNVTPAINVRDYLSWLGLEVRDRVTQFQGVVSSISFDLYGCVQAIVTPKVKVDMKRENSEWFDVKRLEQVKKKPVMEVPTFTTPEIGAAEKPSHPSQPLR